MNHKPQEIKGGDHVCARRTPRMSQTSTACTSNTHRARTRQAPCAHQGHQGKALTAPKGHHGTTLGIPRTHERHSSMHTWAPRHVWRAPCRHNGTEHGSTYLLLVLTRGHGHLDMAWAHTSVKGKHTDALDTWSTGTKKHLRLKECLYLGNYASSSPAAWLCKQFTGCVVMQAVMAVVCALEMVGGSVMEALRERIARMEEMLGEWPHEDDTVASWEEHTM
ncbi:hypothetical protein CK203_037018 [Vitis vinifera]|uniref:Uncharacterized protein n=1 Tax=Vitis vinifera TaxID=29760 RepID=A0A438IUP0_VITVI|nr:hypothetical protein CK203_037018 [Vitis vinifera]